MGRLRPTRQAVAERRAEALRLRRLGAPYSEVAERLGYSSESSASRDVHRALAHAVAEEGKALLALERQRTEVLLARAVELMASDDMKAVRAIEAATKVLERRARMLGIDQAAGVLSDERELEEARSVLGRFMEAVHSAEPGAPNGDGR